MRIGSIIRIIALVAFAALLISSLSGCFSDDDVYGGTSDFIQVSHPDTPNTNSFSDENNGYSSSSLDGTGSGENGDSSGSGSKNSSKNKGGFSDSDLPTVSGDQGPVVVF